MTPDQYFQKKMKKKLPVLITFVTLVSGAFLYSVFERPTPSALEKFTTDFTKEELSQNTLNLHFTLAYPEKYGLVRNHALLPSYCTCSPEEKGTYEADLSFLQTLEESRLSDNEIFLKNLLCKQLSDKISFADYPYLDNPLSPHSGEQATLLTLLSEYNFYTPKDIEDYLELIALIPSYFDSLTSYMEEKVNMGLSPGSDILSETAMSCKEYFPVKELMSGTHFLQESFAQRLSKAKKEFSLTDQQISSYKKKHDSLLKDTLRPAYLSLSKSLTILADQSAVSKGLAGFPGGQKYYELLLKSQTGTRLTPKEIKESLLNNLKENIQTCMDYHNLSPVIFDEKFVSGVQEAFPLRTKDEMLSYLQTRCARDFPAPSQNLQKHLQTRLSLIPESQQSTSAPAFYLLPPVDKYNENVIYTNPKDDADVLTMFTTLAHEGFPGHLFQTTYAYDLWSDTPYAILRSILSFPGFQEGYALYVELLSYDYTAELYDNMELTQMKDYVLYQKANRSFQLSLLTLLEFMIHEENASLYDIQKALKSFGLTDTSSMTSLYNYIVSEPCCYTKYYLGYLEICTLKQEALKLWGEYYTDYAFHSFLLNNGPADFENLHNLLYKIQEPSYTCLEK